MSAVYSIGKTFEKRPQPLYAAHFTFAGTPCRISVIDAELRDYAKFRNQAKREGGYILPRLTPEEWADQIRPFAT